MQGLHRCVGCILEGHIQLEVECQDNWGIDQNAGRNSIDLYCNPFPHHAPCEPSIILDKVDMCIDVLPHECNAHRHNLKSQGELLEAPGMAATWSSHSTFSKFVLEANCLHHQQPASPASSNVANFLMHRCQVPRNFDNSLNLSCPTSL